MAAIEYGIWSDAAGGFIATALYNEEQCAKELAALIAGNAQTGGEDPADLQVLQICSQHEEQPANGCEECEEEDQEEDEGCPGHESLRGDLMGAAHYCDGSCQ